jgi:hypothetical protein
VTTADTSLAANNLLNRGFTGDDGDWDADLWGLAAAALEQTVPNGCLDGFRRSDADLHVILVAAGAPDSASDDAVNALVGSVGSGHTLRLDALLPATGCGADTSDYAVVVANRGGAVEDLCADDWMPAFTRFAEYPDAGAPVRLALTAAPIESTIAVTVEGVTWTSWRYDAEDRSVVLDGPDVPALGAEVTVRYVPASACG